MLKYVNTDIVFQEIPDEVTLAINLSNCPCRCPGCHSKYLWGNTGEELTEEKLDDILREYLTTITCVSFMGGDADPQRVGELAKYVHTKYCNLKTAWYSGKTIVSTLIERNDFDFIKIGPYIEHLGPLKDRNTNQRLYKVEHPSGELSDVTSWFWKK